MEASLGVPTATSVRTLPAKLLEINRQILNNQLARDRGGKVSFTHLIGFAVVRALGRVPSMNASFGVVDGTPSVVRHTHVNLGLAIDQQKSDGTQNTVGAERQERRHARLRRVPRRVRGSRTAGAQRTS